MITREIGPHAIELETGPYTFLVSQGIPVAFQDRSPHIPAPGLFVTSKFFSKATSRKINDWVTKRSKPNEDKTTTRMKRQQGRAVVSHDQLLAVFSSISRFDYVEASQEPEPKPKPPEEGKSLFEAMVQQQVERAVQKMIQGDNR